MNRSNVYLTSKQLMKLRRLSKHTGAPMAELIRRAVDAYLAGHGGGNDKVKKLAKD